MDFLLWWLISLLGFFSAVGPVDHSDDGGSAEPSVSASPVVDPVQEQWIRRAPLPSCGEHAVEQSYVEASALPGWRCLEQAANGRGAEAQFIVGGPGQVNAAVTYVRVADGVMEIYVNDPADPVRPWTYESCPTEVASFRQGCP